MKFLTPLSKRINLLLAGLVLASLSANAQFSGDSFAEAKAKGTANVVYTFVETPGFAEKEGVNVNGFCVELMNEFGKWLKSKEGIDLKPVFQDQHSKDFTKFMDMMKKSSNGVFGLGTFTITEERKNSYNFSPPYITNLPVLMTHNKVASLKRLQDISTGFEGMSMVTVKGSFNEKRLLEIKKDHFPQARVKYVGSFDEVLKELAANEKAFTELDFIFYIAAMKQRLPIKHHSVSSGPADNMGIIMPKNSDWVPVMERFMKSGFVGSTEYRRLIAKHLGQHALKLLDSVSAQ